MQNNDILEISSRYTNYYVPNSQEVFVYVIVDEDEYII